MLHKAIAFISVLTISLAFANQAFSQSTNKVVKKTFQVEEGEAITLNLDFGDKIKVSGWDKQKVQFKAVININDGNLNDALILDFENSGDELKISVDYDEQMIKKGTPEDCPDKYSQYSWSSNGQKYFICSEVSYEIFIPKRADLKVETISGNIVLTNLKGQIYANTISGFIDLTRSAGADLMIESITGKAYTNIDNFQIKEKDVTGWSLSIKSLLNGGGPDVTLETISGNIYLREG